MIPLRYPLYSLTVTGNSKLIDAAKTFKETIKKLCNVKEVYFVLRE